MDTKSQNRQELEARAEALGVKFAANIGDDKLEERIAEAEAAQNTQGLEPTQAGTDDGEAGTKAGAAGAAPADQAGATGISLAETTRPEVSTPRDQAHEDMVSAEVLRPLRRNGQKYKPGHLIEIDQKTFDYLAAKGVVA